METILKADSMTIDNIVMALVQVIVLISSVCEFL